MENGELLKHLSYNRYNHYMMWITLDEKSVVKCTVILCLHDAFYF